MYVYIYMFVYVCICAIYSIQHILCITYMSVHSTYQQAAAWFWRVVAECRSTGVQACEGCIRDLYWPELLQYTVMVKNVW